MDSDKIELLGFRPRLNHEYGEGWVLSVTVEELDDPSVLQEAIKALQTGYVRISMRK